VKLSREELFKKFPELNKFQDQKWLSEEAIKSDCNYKKLPLLACFKMIKNLIYFIDKTRFSNHWEECFSVKNRLMQIESLLSFFCEDTITEQTLKGDNINLPHPIEMKPK